jgi:hypothetical protein
LNRSKFSPVELRAPRARDSSGWERREQIQVYVSRRRRHHSWLDGRTAPQVDSRLGLFGTMAGLEKGDRRECRARDRRTCVRALGNGCAAPNPAVNARVEDSRAEDPESLSFASSEAFPTCRCLSVHHWPHLAGVACAYARENLVAFNWTGNCVTCDRGVAEDSAHDGPDRRVHGQRSTRR